MTTNRKVVYFFCDNYTIPFVVTEIGNLSKTFERVVVVSGYDFGKLPYLNVELAFVKFDDYSVLKILFRNFSLFFSMFLKEIVLNPSYLKYPKAVLNLFREYLQCSYIKDKLKETLSGDSYHSFYYCFWFNRWATVLSILVRQNKIESYTSRIHGADLYEERVPFVKKLPYRRFQLNYVKHLCSVSKKGELYLNQHYPDFRDKIRTSYLGTVDGGENPFVNDGVFTIVSCAKVRNIKRIHSLADVVNSINIPIKWIHIGDEYSNSEDSTIKIYHSIKDQILQKSNIEFISTGPISNVEVFELYNTIPINAFVSLSETEGLPVSMMEAISFGIPIISTDVGGCSEIVTANTGLLINSGISKFELINVLKDFVSSNYNTIKFRKGARKFWLDNFNNENNFNAFINNSVN